MNDLTPNDAAALFTLKKFDRITCLTLDNPPVNATSNAVRAGLNSYAEMLDQDASVDAVVLLCAGRTFIAGGDVKEFDLPPQEPSLPDVVMRIETAAKPWIAAIHGAALGGGLEIAMGCRFRVATETAKLGLPEVNLGLIPGASGTVRTPRLAGMDMAIQLAVSGKPITAQAALEAGLIDGIIGADLQAEALAFARKALAARLPLATLQRPNPHLPDAYWQEATAKAPNEGHAAHQSALACLRYGSEHDAKAALAHERDTFLTLRSSFEARALRHVFLAERAAPKPRVLRDTTPRALQHCGVIGGGTMGAGIAAACLLSGLQVTLIERTPEAAQAGLNNVQTILNGALKRGKLTPETYEQRMAALACGDDYAALQPCDVVIEAVFEDLAVKQEVFRKLTEVCGPETVLATNTSYLDPSLIVAGLPHPERFIGLHFFSPAHVMKLLEIVPTDATSQDVLATGFALGKRLGKIPVQAGICEGFIGNRILKRYRAEAEALVRQGVSIADIDAAMRAFGFRMGPFEAQDLGGLDIAYLQREAARNSGATVERTLGDILVEAGRKGQKTQGGWYDYVARDRTPKPSEAVTELLRDQITAGPVLTAEAIAERLVGAMAAEGQAILDEGIAQAASDIDLVEVHGYGFPRWKGGPMFYGANAGAS